MSACLAGENTDTKFESCVNDIVSSLNATVLEIRHLGHDRFSHVHLRTPDDHTHARVLADLDAEEIEAPGDL
jgi:hypothetical protein